MDNLDQRHPAADGESNIGWIIQGASRKHKTQATETCFIGGLAGDTSGEKQVLGDKSHGAEIKKCHMLPTKSVSLIPEL